MARIIMYWDRQHLEDLGVPAAGITVDSNHYIEIPANACGFRLGRPHHEWHGGWQFMARHQSAPLKVGSIEYSSAFTGQPSPDAIVAIGPVHGCATGNYEFQTPLGAYGITGDAPLYAGAGSFVADFTDEDDIEWLDYSGKPIPRPGIKPDPKPPKLPDEFFEQPPKVSGCIRDSEGKLHCPDPASAAAMAHSARSPALRRGVAAAAGIIPEVKAINQPTGPVSTTFVRASKIETKCPVELILTATFYKDYTFDPAVVEYRFRFAHGPVSTVFSTRVDKDGANTVFHSVPIPLPQPIGQTPAGGGGGITPGAVELTAAVIPEGPGSPGGVAPAGMSEFTIEPRPANEHRSSVRVEVINAAGGIVASPWERYHIVCTGAASRRVLGRGSSRG
jgi:hypothetical protein